MPLHIVIAKNILENEPQRVFRQGLPDAQGAEGVFPHTFGRALNESKQLEREIDAEIERVNRVMAERRNPKMNFDKKAE